jgi:hypothetical protein
MIIDIMSRKNILLFGLVHFIFGLKNYKCASCLYVKGSSFFMVQYMHFFATNYCATLLNSSSPLHILIILYQQMFFYKVQSVYTQYVVSLNVKNEKKSECIFTWSE